MKKFALIFCLALLVSCETSRFLTMETFWTDFRPYTERGFHFSTAPIFSEYTSLGEINCVCTGGYDVSKSKVKESEVGIKYAKIGMNKEPIPCNVQDVIDEMYIEASKIGANGVMNLKIEYIENPKNQIYSKVSATGLAIKIKN